MSSKNRIDLGRIKNKKKNIFNVISAPVEKSQDFIDSARENSGDLAKYAYFGEVPVGVIVAEQRTIANEDCLIITHLAVLDSYSLHFNVETTLIQHILDLVPKRHVKRCYFTTGDAKLVQSTVLSEMGFQATTEILPGAVEDHFIFVT